ncbi:unnamed protein product [Mytilus coruscus]|uniref:Uncharacterized protein n=1 Tax=Mytilus coruscus TaxID=42192 RepID=A0A6J8AT54_MYTCO|nr:unnamed protein product [Mytilus coruscus]
MPTSKSKWKAILLNRCPFLTAFKERPLGKPWNRTTPKNFREGSNQRIPSTSAELQTNKRKRTNEDQTAESTYKEEPQRIREINVPSFRAFRKLNVKLKSVISAVGSGTALYHASANIKLFLGGNIAFQKKIGQNKRSQEAFNHYLEEDVVLYPVKTKLDPCRKTLRISKSHGSYTELESKIVN